MTCKRRALIIAIDGPAGSGKSTLARRLAEDLGYLYVDTGAMYRGITWKALSEGIDLTDSRRLVRLAARTKIALTTGPRGTMLSVDGRDVSEEIRTPRVTEQTHHLAALAGVRRRMVELQREIGRKGCVVVEGRDIGTVVFPDADFKFYLDADVNERAKRRCKELREIGIRIRLQEVKMEVEARDEKDRTRKIAPLKVAAGAVVLDSTDMTVEEELAAVKGIIAGGKRRPRKAGCS